MKFGVIGYGYWGPNIVRNLMAFEGSQVLAIAEISPQARLRAQKAHPGVKVLQMQPKLSLRPKSTRLPVCLPCGQHY